MSHGQSSHRCSLLRIALNLSEPTNMGSFMNVVVKLYRYKDSDVGNIQKSNIFAIILNLFVRREIQFN